MKPAAFALIAVLASNCVADSAPSIQVRLERWSDGKWTTVDPTLVLASGDRVRFQFISSVPGHLTVWNRPSAGGGGTEPLFPLPSGSNNRIEAGRLYTVPAAGHFSIEGPPGFEETHWYLSREEHLRVPKSPPARPSGDGPLIPRCRDSELRARGVCTDPRAGAVMPPPSGAAGDPALRRRGLRFERENLETRIGAEAGGSGPVYYVFRVAHQ